ncbi:MAG: helix-turn-helix transcriptional regulator [Ruminococcaceae bacterium]|nr:helix-turn-helix transcriptional regulator [Oscillospiraceae bacterium]
MQTTTEKLLAELKSTTDIETFFKEHEGQFLDKTTHSYLNELISLKNMNISDVAKNSGSGEYVYKIFSGERKPSRDILISVAFGMKLSLEETQLLLRITKFAILDSRDKRDSVIIYGLTHSMNIFETDDMLYKKDLVTIN